MPKAFITLKELPALKRSYRSAVESGKKEFRFNGNPVLVDYAKFLIEYMEGEVKRLKTI